LIVAWRLCRAPHAALDGEGARRFGGRWNSPGRPVVYLADHPALAVLEVLVHLDLPPEDLPDDYVILRVMLAGESLPETTAPEPHPRAAGDAWLERRLVSVLRVTSAIVPQAFNLLLNPLHPEAAVAMVAESTPFRFDPRLWRGA
jgi:RES domain-containing protein